MTDFKEQARQAAEDAEIYGVGFTYNGIRVDPTEVCIYHSAKDRLSVTTDELRALLPGQYYMDPPDGGSVTVLEQLQRMAVDAANWRLAATPGLRHGAEVSFSYGGIKIDDGCFICIEYGPEDRESQPEVPYPRMRCMFAGSTFDRFELSDITDLRVIK